MLKVGAFESRKAYVSAEIALLLCAKFAALAILYYAFFSPTAQPHVDAGSVARQILN